MGCRFILTKFRQLHFVRNAWKLGENSSSDLITNREKSRLQLSQYEIHKINLLLPRLYLSGHITTAIRLLAAALPLLPHASETPDPTKTFSIRVLVHFITAQSDMCRAMSLLIFLSRSTYRQHLSHVVTLVIASYLRKTKLEEALKVYRWLYHHESSFQVERRAFDDLGLRLYENGMVQEALRVLGDMLKVRITPGFEFKKAVYMSLLREAFVDEALELNRVLTSTVEDLSEEDFNRMTLLLDSIIYQLK